jgi:glycerol-3-phosphate dehydrogenase
LNHKFLKSDKALMIPKTSDGRILFAVPWHNHTLVGTTDAYTDKISNDPTVTDKEIDFMLETANEYFDEDPTRDDILSCFAGIRPLVTKGNTLDTKSISRSHGVSVSKSGMVNITGGKWTTYRKMAEDTIDKALKVSTLSFSKCNTADLKLDHGGTSVTEKRLQIYGGFASQIMELERKDKKLAKRIHPDLPYTRAQVIWACDNELAMTVEDVLARRTRALFLNAKAAKQSAKKVAELMASTMDKSEQWQDQQVRLFKAFADGYLVS